MHKGYAHFSACLSAILLLNNISASGQILWSNVVGQAWLTGTNWTGGAVPGSTDIAQFGTAPTSGTTGVGINMNMPTNNGANNQAVGAIEILATRVSAGMLIGNSSTSSGGTLTLNGATVNAVNNVILRNGCPNLFVIEDYQALNNSFTMGVALNNATDNIILLDGAGGITISSVISGAAKKLTLGGSGAAVLSLSAANTYSGLTTVSSNTLQLNNAGGGTIPSGNNVLVNGTGILKVSTNQTIHDFAMSGGTLLVDAGVVLTITGAYSVTGGTINNLGTIKLNGGAISFPGTGVTVNNGFANTMTRLEIASSGNITQTASFTIDNELKLTSGILVSGAANHLTLNGGTIVTGVSNASFVDGPVSKIGNSTFSFPVGKINCGPSGTVNGYAALEISNFTGSAPTDKFTAEYKRGDALLLGAISALGLDHVSRCDYWTLTRDIGAAKVDIRLFWDEPVNNCITTAPYVNKLLSLTVAHSNNPGAWDNYGINGLTTGTTTTGSVYWSGFQSSSFGAFAIGSIDFFNPLPVTIRYFNGVRQNGKHLLSWKVSCSNNPDVTMVLERNTGNNDFQPVYTVTASALQCQQPFGYTDAAPAAGINYYRLKLVNAAGKISYSNLLPLLNADKGIVVLNISPNPVTGDNFNLGISAAGNEFLQIAITDMEGRLLQRQTVHVTAGFNLAPVNVRGLAAGIYQLGVFAAGEKSRVLRFIVQ